MKTNWIPICLNAFLLVGVFSNPALASGAAAGATTLPASGVTTYQATLNGVVDTGSQAATAWFEYGLTTSYGNSTEPITLAAGTAAYPSVDVLFNGTSQNAVVPGFGTYAPTNEVTIEFWQYVVDAQAQSSFILNPDVGTNRINAHVPWLDGNIYWDFGNIEGNGRLSVLASKVVGHWVNVALVATQSGNDMLIYINGIIQAQSGSMTPFQQYAADLLLGGGGVNNFYFNGAMADFRIWNKALDPSTLQAWMNQPLTSSHPYWTNLVAYWPMNEGSGSVLNDQSGNGHTAYLSNAPAWQIASNSQVSTTVQGLAQGRIYHYALVVSQGGQIFVGPDATFTTPAPANLNASLPLTVLHNFNATNTNPDVLYNVVLSGRTLYGTTYGSGSNGSGMVFSLNTDGSDYTVLHSFSTSSSSNDFVNVNGAYPLAPLTVAGGTLYGTTTIGGTHGAGTLFAMNTDGSGFTTLYNFAGNNDGSGPEGALLLVGNTLYGTTEFGGTNDGSGTAYSIQTDGTGYNQLHAFNGFGTDGNAPQGGLILAGNRLYGVTQVGGGASATGTGAVFAMNTDGSGFTVLHAFGPLTFNGTFNYNADGGDPNGGLVLLNGMLYGTLFLGGPNGVGAIFAVNTNGTGFTNLYTFTAGNDGAVPNGGLLLLGNTLYGAAGEGGANGNGTIFKINPDGTGLVILHSFSALGYNSSGVYGNGDGAGPTGNLFMSGGLLYDTTFSGGTYDDGTVFTLALGPELAITPAGGDVVLTWPANEAGFSLQSSPALAPAQTWSPVSPLPVAANSQFAVTNAATGQELFYRLTQ